jgi:hypothetical protein
MRALAGQSLSSRRNLVRMSPFYPTEPFETIGAKVGNEARRLVPVANAERPVSVRKQSLAVEDRRPRLLRQASEPPCLSRPRNNGQPKISFDMFVPVGSITPRKRPQP